MARAPGVSRVVCFEVDENVLEAARHNPASRGLFENPRIELRAEDVFEGIDAFPEGTFDRAFHDPPRLSLAGELYSLEFYRKMFRVLKPRGRLFHYTGAPGDKAGKRIRTGVIRRLQEAGFEQVRERQEAQGVSAVKPARRRP
jgi:predicted methyltransferase